MKYITLAAALLLSSTSAFAADAIAYNEPAPVAVDTFSWTGGYIGVNAGYAGGKFKTTFDVYDDYDDSFSLSSNASGFIGGVQAGYNWQMDKMILGLETDFQASGLKSDSDIDNQINLGTKINWFGTTRARIGYTPIDRFMVYATGGVAYGKVKTFVSTPDYYSSQSDTKVGYTVGAGAEYAITNNVTMKTEYLYTDLGKLKIEDDAGFRFGEAKSAFHTVRVGLNYKF